MELGIRSDHSNLPQVLQDLAAIVLPVPQDGDRHGGSPPVLCVGLLLAEMNVGLIPADSEFGSTDKLLCALVSKRSLLASTALPRLPQTALPDEQTTDRC